MKTPFVWLGSKRAAKRGVGAKGALLDQAAAAGLPTPRGAILLHEFYQLLRDDKLIHESGGRVWADDPIEIFEAVYTAVRFPRLPHPVAVRAAFTAVDNQEQELPGGPPRLHVDLRDAPALTEALCAVWSAALPHADRARRDVLIMEMATSDAAGVAYLGGETEVDQITTTAADALSLPQLRRWQRPSTNLPPFAQRLQLLLRGIRRTFNREDVDQGNWRVEWIDDGAVCWLLQIEQGNRPSS